MLFKYKRDKRLLLFVHPILISIYADIYFHVYEKFNINLIITQTISTKEEDNRLMRTSPAHREGRAIDVSVVGLSPDIIAYILKYANGKKWEEYKYQSFSGKKRIAYYHDNGNGRHLHLAIHSRFSIIKE